MQRPGVADGFFRIPPWYGCTHFQVRTQPDRGPSGADRGWKGGAAARARSDLKKVGASDIELDPTCRVLTEKMQEQSLVSQGFAGF